jgi:hypothetical protein
MKRVIVALISLSSLSLTAAALELNMTAATTPAVTAPLINHAQVTKALKNNDYTQLVKEIDPLVQALKQFEAQNAAPAATTDSSNKDKAPTDPEAQTDDNILDDLLGTLIPLVDGGNTTNLTSLVTHAEELVTKQAQAAASPTSNMTAPRQMLFGVAAILVALAEIYFGIVKPFQEKQDSTAITTIPVALTSALYGVYDFYLGLTNRNAKAKLAHAQANASTLKDLHTKTQTIIANSPRVATVASLPAPVAVSVSPTITTPNLIDLDGTKKS